MRRPLACRTRGVACGLLILATPKPLRSMIGHIERGSRQRKSSRVWLDLGDFGELVTFDDAGTFQDHGLGLLRTILHHAGVTTDLASTRTVAQLAGVRSYNYGMAVQSAEVFKQLNPHGVTACAEFSPPDPWYRAEVAMRSEPRIAKRKSRNICHELGRGD